MPRKKGTEKVCPRCGQPYSYIERKEIRGTQQKYYYAVHLVKEEGKWKKKRCYLGPKVYAYATKIQGFQLYGLMETKRLIEYLEDITQEILSRANKLTEDDIKRVRRIREMLNSLE
ncbi:MAG: hypothetical protein J7J65_01755 [Candidatus Korarchaeota archaeon]|nr:hypothetical protein [Candidatus Korarchaeota archaeon]